MSLKIDKRIIDSGSHKRPRKTKFQADLAPSEDRAVRLLKEELQLTSNTDFLSDALALYFQRRGEISVVLTDVSMAQMDGVSLVRSLRRVDPKAKIIVSSGHLQKEMMTVLSSLGVKTFLNKPYTADKLLRAVQATLKDEPHGVEEVAAS